MYDWIAMIMRNSKHECSTKKHVLHKNISYNIPTSP